MNYNFFQGIRLFTGWHENITLHQTYGPIPASLVKTYKFPHHPAPTPWIFMPLPNIFWLVTFFIDPAANPLLHSGSNRKWRALPLNGRGRTTWVLTIKISFKIHKKKKDQMSLSVMLIRADSCYYYFQKRGKALMKPWIKRSLYIPASMIEGKKSRLSL